MTFQNGCNNLSIIVGPIGLVNCCDLIDSNYALDGVPRRRDNGSMTDTGDTASHKLQMLVLERRDASVNMARFYVLAIEPTLFGDTAVVREWGRIGSLGRRRLDLYPDGAAAGRGAVEKPDRRSGCRVLPYPRLERL